MKNNLFSEKAKSTISCLLLLTVLPLAARIKVAQSPADRPDWAFRPGDEVLIQVDAADAASLAVEDFYGERQTVLPARQEDDSVLFPLPTQNGGLFVIRAGEETVRYAVIPAPPKTVGPDGRFGVNFHLDRTPLDDGLKEIGYAKFIGISWGRGMFKEFVNCANGNYEESTASFDAELAQAKASGINILGNIYAFPRFVHAEKGDGFIWYAFTAPEDMSEVTRYTRFIARKCPYVRYWEVGNECDAELFWRGRASSAGSTQKIIADYVDFLRAAAAGFKEGNPDCKILFAGGTGGMPEGETHRPFLKTVCEAGAIGLVDVMNLHYRGSIPRCREVMAPYVDGRDIPFWVTELGGSAAGTPALEKEIFQLRRDMLHSLEQFSDGAAKVFKYNMRNMNLEGPTTDPNSIEDNFGLITLDFQPKLPYLAYAAMIRLIEGSDGMRRIRITDCADDGYLKGFSWNLDGTEYSCIVLENAEKAIATLPVADKAVTLIDIFGNEKSLAADDGKITLAMNAMPVFLRGRLAPPPGPVTYPVDRLVRSVAVDIPNARFQDGRNGWNCGFPEGTTFEKTPDGLRIDFDMMDGNGYAWLFNWGDIDLAEMRKQLQPKQYFRILVRGELRFDLEGRGVNVGVNLCPARNTARLRWQETAYTSAKSDWTTFEVHTEPLDPAENALALAFNVAPGTAGWFEVRNAEMTVEIWEAP